jgi:hypothetical protein
MRSRGRILEFALGGVAAFQAALVGWTNYPGGMSSDTFGILIEARANEYRDTHPPLLTFIWRQLDQVWPGQAPVFILDLFLFYGGLFLLFYAFRNRLGWLSVLGLFTVGLWPAVIGIIGVVWLDIFMASLFMASIGLFFASKELPKGQNIARVLSWIFLIFGLVTRLNSAAAVVPIAVVYLLPLTKPSLGTFFARALAAVAIVMFAFLLNMQLTQLIVKEPRTHFWTWLPLFDIAGISKNANSYEFSRALFPSNSLADVETLYSPRYCTYLLTGQSATGQSAKPFDMEFANAQEGRKELVRNWGRAIAEHPYAYLVHRVSVYGHLKTKMDVGLWGAVHDGISYDGLPLEYLGIPSRPRYHNELYERLASLDEETSLFEPRWYLMLAAFSGAAAVFLLANRSWNTLLLSVAALAGSSLSHSIGLFFTALSADFRYSHWSIVTGLAAFFLIASWAIQGAVARWRKDLPDRPTVLTVGSLAIVGVVSAFAWRAYSVSSYSTFESEKGAAADKAVGLGRPLTGRIER